MRHTTAIETFDGPSHTLWSWKCGCGDRDGWFTSEDYTRTQAEKHESK